MTRDEQCQFVSDLTVSIAKKVQRKIATGDVPDDWDGHELREYLADLFNQERSSLMKSGRRRKDYRNIVAICNL